MSNAADVKGSSLGIPYNHQFGMIGVIVEAVLIPTTDLIQGIVVWQKMTAFNLRWFLSQHTKKTGFVALIA